MDHKISKDMISSGMTPSGEKSQADLGRTQYGSAPSPSRLMDAYKSMYEHHQKDADGKVIEHEEEEIKEMSGGGGVNTDTKVETQTGTKPVKKPGLLQRLGDRKKATDAATSTLNQDVDLFDIIKGRLLDEGADEEEALKIMANISQEDFDKLKEDITLTKGDYASRNTSGSAYNTAKSKGFKGYKAGGGLGADFLPRV